MTTMTEPRTSPAAPDPGQPIPFTLTPRAHAALDQDDATPAADAAYLRGIAADLSSTAGEIASDIRLIGRAGPASLEHARDLIGILARTPDDLPGPDQWGCERCGAAWFGTPPEDGLCPDCRAGKDGR